MEQSRAMGEQVIRFHGGSLSIGRNDGNDVVLDDLNVSRFHATIAHRGQVIELRDLESRCGTRLNGRPVKRAVISSGDEIGIGPFKIRFDGSGFEYEDERGAMRLDARQVSFAVEGRQIVRRASLAVEPGQLVAIIGASGAGKTTLLKTLAGVIRPSEGEVTLNREPITSRLTDVGYVPQQEIIHRLLTVSEALGYAARLRLPPDTSRRDVKATVERVLGELSLEGQRSTRIDRISGGERKRTAVASELLHRPGLLFLDEPTTGLDPELESQLMTMFRELAAPRTRAVVLVTHATRNLALCDRLAVVGRGGELTFVGEPREALGFFGVDSYDAIYSALASRPAIDWRRDFERRRPAGEPAKPPAAEVPEPGPAGSARAKQGSPAQLGLLTGRYLRLFLRDRRNLSILLGQVPLIGIAIAFLFKSGLFDRSGSPPLGSPDDGAQLLFLLVTTAIWFGSIAASREIVKERSIAAREAAVGVRLAPYLLSKAIVLFALVAVQTTALAFFVLAVRPLDAGVSTYASVIALLVLTSFVAVGVGLLVSAAVSSEDQATSFIPLTLIPQLLFAGAIVPVAQMAEPIASISNAVFARWSLAGVGAAAEMDERLTAEPRLAEAAGFEDFFEVLPGRMALVLLGFLILLFVAAAAMAARRRRLDKGRG